MPQDDESFLDAVLQPVDEVPRVKRSPWPAPAPGPSAEDGEDPGEAYKPDVVGPRIRNALKGGHGLAGSPRRYAMIVAVMVGLTSLPTWAVLHAGLRETRPAPAVPAEVFLAQPLALPPVIVHTQTHKPAPAKRKPRVTRTAVAHPPIRVRPAERSIPKKVPAQRPVAKPVVSSQHGRVHVPCHTWLPWKGPDRGLRLAYGFRRGHDRSGPLGPGVRYLTDRPSPERSTWTVSPSWISPASSARAS